MIIIHQLDKLDKSRGNIYKYILSGQIEQEKVFFEWFPLYILYFFAAKEYVIYHINLSIIAD